jgi:hypothetical protein
MFLYLSPLCSIAAPPADNSAEMVAMASPVRVVQDASGSPLLLVDYPWARHENPSIEVRMNAPGEQDDRSRIQPLAFVDRLMKGDVTVDIYTCQEKAATLRSAKAFSSGQIDFTIIGDRNLLGMPAVCVACRTPSTASGAESQKAPRAIFPLLRPWASDDHTLILELPKEYFASPCTIRVWFLRRDRTVWSEKLAWPGQKE